MGSVKTIYLSDPSKEMLEKLKKENPNFSLSSFIQKAIVEINRVETVEDVQLRISELNAKDEALRAERESIAEMINTLGEKKRKFYEKEKEAERIKKEEEKYEKNKKILEDFVMSIHEKPELHDEYLEGVRAKKWGSTITFARLKLGLEESEDDAP